MPCHGVSRYREKGCFSPYDVTKHEKYVVQLDSIYISLGPQGLVTRFFRILLAASAVDLVQQICAASSDIPFCRRQHPSLSSTPEKMVGNLKGRQSIAQGLHPTSSRGRYGKGPTRALRDMSLRHRTSVCNGTNV